MSDSYEIDGVKITPGAGGYYDLEHKSLGEPERVRGKEAADRRAAEIAKAAEAPEGRMEPQGGLTPGVGGDIVRPGDTRSPAERSQENAAAGGDANLDPTKAPKEAPKSQAQIDSEKAREQAEVTNGTLDNTRRAPEPKAGDDEKDAKIAALEASNADLSAKFDKLLEALKPAAATAVEVGGEPDLPAVPMTMPRHFTGELDSKVKSALEKQGIGFTKIVLEENESIPPTGLFVGHNGRSYMISPGVEVDVPNFLLGVLNDAVMSAPVVDSTTQKVLGYRNRSKYPYREVK